MKIFFKEFLQTSIPPLISELYAEGYHDFPLKNIRVTMAKIFVEEPVCVSENFGYRQTLWLRGENPIFLKNVCCLTVPKNFVGEPFFSQNFWWRIKLCLRWGRGGWESITIFCQFFCLTLPKNFVGEPFWSVFQKVSGSETVFMDKRGGHHGFVEIFCLTGPKRRIWRRNPSVFQKVFGIEKN